MEINHHRHHGRAASQGHHSRRPRRPRGQGHPGPKIFKNLKELENIIFVKNIFLGDFLFFFILENIHLPKIMFCFWYCMQVAITFLIFFRSEHLLRIMINILTYLMYGAIRIRLFISRQNYL